jgi:xanthine dehydrogenase accessory factor
VLGQALQSPARYVGCIGSRRKVEITKQRLRDEAGIDARRVAELYSPIGITIGAETPAEIAVSIAAELIAFRSEGIARFANHSFM